MGKPVVSRYGLMENKNSELVNFVQESRLVNSHLLRNASKMLILVSKMC